MVKIENEYLELSVLDHGAELCSIFDKRNQREVMWKKDETYWNRYSPILFPNVGKTFQNVMKINGTLYPTKQHGFARDSVFTLLQHTENIIRYSLKASEDTKKIYPYLFELILGYELIDEKVIVSYEVINHGNLEMYYTIGAHPAFAIPFDGADGENLKYHSYGLFFKGKEELQYLLADSEIGCALKNLHSMKLENECYTLSEDTFVHGARIFDHQIEEVTIIRPDKKPLLTLKSPGFPSYGIWSVPGAPFLCLEPWMGRCDDVGFQTELKEKPMVCSLLPHKTDKFYYEIICHNE